MLSHIAQTFACCRYGHTDMLSTCQSVAKQQQSPVCTPVRRRQSCASWHACSNIPATCMHERFPTGEHTHKRGLASSKYSVVNPHFHQTTCYMYVWPPGVMPQACACLQANYCAHQLSLGVIIVVHGDLLHAQAVEHHHMLHACMGTGAWECSKVWR